MTQRQWRIIHRYCGLGLASFIIFYSVTGILLNHRKSFGYFFSRETTTSAMERIDATSLQQLLAVCKERINRNDDPRVIRIPDSETIEFLYGSHGKVTYRLKPAAGSMEIIEKKAVQPFVWLNRLHKAGRVSWFWLLCADLVCIFALALTVSGLIIMRYKRRDYILLISGLFVLFMGMALA